MPCVPANLVASELSIKDVFDGTMQHLNLSTVSLLGVAASLFFLLFEAHAESGPKTITAGVQTSQSAFVRFADDRLTVEVSRVPLQGLLREIARQSGLDIMIHGSLEESVSMKFDRLSFDQGLRRILRRHSFVFEYAGETKSTVRRLKALWVLANGKRVPSHKRMAHADIEWTSSPYIETEMPAQPTSYPEEEESLIEVLAGVDGEEVIQDLAIALQDEDPLLRAEVIAAIGEAGGATAVRSLDRSLLNSDARAQGTAVPSDN